MESSPTMDATETITPQENMPAVVEITESAATKAQAVLANSENKGIRIAVTGGGCAGLQYDLKPEAGPQENDLVIDAYGVPFYVHPMVLPYIKGTIIDFSNALMDGGFKFINPNATNTCGCGTSFGI
jgi:iron-sulfur cluster assembly protein